MSFDTLGLAEPLLRAVREKGYVTPSPIQAQAIPAILQGQDIMAAAQTGTGKTAGFTLPLLQRLMDGPAVKPNGVRALVLTPTRELAAQVAESVETYGKFLKLRSTVVFGGVSINPQMKNLRRGVDVLVATPGRLMDLYQQNAVKFNQIEILVLDEADRMLDMGFIHDIKKILKLLPENRQNLLFSATFSGEIRTLAKGLLNSPVEIDVAPRNTTASLVEQLVHPVDKAKKAALLSHLIRSQEWTQAIVFSRTKHGANRLVEYLMGDGISAAAIHSNKSQGARTKALSEFKQGKVSILVATDIAARGLDIPQMPQVVNFDLPNVPEDYVHRIGRTGRAGEAGHAISLVSADEAKQLADIERVIKRKLPREEIFGYEAKHAVPEAKADAEGARRSGGGENRNRGGQRQQPRNQEQRPRNASQGEQQGARRDSEGRDAGQNSGRGQQRRNEQGGQRRSNNTGERAAGGRGQVQAQGRGQRDGRSKAQGAGQGNGQRNSQQRTGQQRNQSRAVNALDSSPMGRRVDPSAEHRRAQAEGNRAPRPQGEGKRREGARDDNHGNRRSGSQGQAREGQAAARAADAPPRKNLVSRIKDWARR